MVVQLWAYKKTECMNENLIRVELASLANTPGVRACALVESSSGLVLQTAGDPTIEQHLWEAAVDYWRVHFRVQSHISDIGHLHGISTYYSQGILVLLPCNSQADLIFICLGAHKGVDWSDVQKKVRFLDLKVNNKL
jgi:hypothetical protein